MRDITDLEYEFGQALTERSAWDTEWKKITDYLLPGRGVYQLYNKPQVRKLVSPKVINTVAREALQVLTSGFHGGLTSPNRPWFDLTFSNEQLMQVLPIKIWLDGCKKVLYSGFEQSNFYQTVHSFYTEFGGFGNGAMYCGEDSLNPFRFELLTVGEYAFTLNAQGQVDEFFRVLYKTNRNLIEQFGEDAVSNSVRQNANINPNEYVCINNVVYPEEYKGKPFTSVYWEMGQKDELSREGFYEFPYFVGRWDIVGSDTYGLGLGSYALPDIQRLQEMEKAFLMGAHKAIDPPVNAPAKKKGKVKTLPGGINYYSNPNELITPVQAAQYNYAPVIEAIGRVENRIRQIFFNDIFLTASRDPNASPLKATEVMERKEEKLLRIGPVIGRVLHEFIAPLIERCFNIAARKGLLPPLDPRYAELVSDYNIRFISPLAQAQKMIEAQPINSFLQFVTGAAQFNPEALDKINVDKLVDEYGDITGIPASILRAQADVDKIRKDRAEAIRAKEQQQLQLAQQQMEMERQKTQAEVAKSYSETGVNMEEAMPGMM